MTELSYNYLAIDPGHQSGWACLNKKGEFIAGERAYDRMIHDAEDTAIACKMKHTGLVLAVERANVNSNRGGRGILRSLSWEMETIGCLKHFSRKYGTKFIQVNKSDALGTASNPLLQEIGWYHEGGDGHARDAARILVAAVIQYDLDFWRKLVVDKGVLQDERPGLGPPFDDWREERT